VSQRGKQEANTLGNMGLLYKAKNDDETNLAYQEEALAIKRLIHDRSGIVTSLHNIAKIEKRRYNIERYLELESEAWQLAQALGEPEALYYVGVELGRYLCDQGEIAVGLPMVKEAYAMGAKVGVPNLENLGMYIQIQEKRLGQ